MHAGFPNLTGNVSTVLRLGWSKGKVSRMVERSGGKLLAHSMARILDIGLAFVMRGSVLSRSQGRKAEGFFRENFEIRDPDTPSGIRYYQGKFLVRTSKPEDDMNVYLKFCPEPEALFTGGWRGRVKKALFGTALNSWAVVETDTLTEERAEMLAHDPEMVDLIISFKDVRAIIGLAEAGQDFDMGQLLLENVVQMKGNVGHLFKFGAIGNNIQLALGLQS